MNAAVTVAVFSAAHPSTLPVILPYGCLLPYRPAALVLTALLPPPGSFPELNGPLAWNNPPLDACEEAWQLQGIHCSQAAWGACFDGWMIVGDGSTGGYCASTCGRCVGIA